MRPTEIPPKNRRAGNERARRTLQERPADARANSAPSSAANFNRPPRIHLPGLPEDEIDIPAPPDMPSPPANNGIIAIIPVMGIVVMALFYVMRSGDTGSSSALFAIPLFFLAAFTIGGTLMAVRWRKRDYEQQKQDAALTYVRLLEKKRARLHAAHEAQIAILEANFPHPRSALERALTRDTSLWERRPTDPDFAAFRIGVGRVPASVKINAPDPDLETEGIERALTLADAYRFVHHAPVAASLLDDHSVGICGARAGVMAYTRAMVCGLAMTHAPQDLRIHLIALADSRDDWRWLEWLPHTSPNQRGGAAELVAYDTDNMRGLLGNLSQVLDERKAQPERASIPHLLVIFDGSQLAESEGVYSTLLREGHLYGASALCLAPTFEDVPGDCRAVIEVNEGGTFLYAQSGVKGEEIEGYAIDELTAQDAEHVARAMASVVMRESGGGGRIPRHVDFLELYGVRYVEELADELRARWGRDIPDGVLPHPVPIGRESLTVDTYLLLDEENHGPHGVLAGTTGAGKSELLQTLVCALAIEHDPRLVNFLLIDFKGGSTFNVFAELPHVVGMVTNLDGERIERTLEALKAETKQRQQFLKRVNVRDIRQYHRYFTRTAAQMNAPDYQPLPHLFIIVDEFAQLAKEMPDFMRELVRTVQVGRSLGLHLILGTQSPMDVITEEMNANLQFRICLRVQNIEASRAMLRRPDAAYLPAGWAGRGYFQVGERGVFKQFQTAYAGGDYVPSVEQNPLQDEDYFLELITPSGSVVDLLPDAVRPTMPDLPPDADEPFTTARAITDMVVSLSERYELYGMPPLLLPPLEERITLAMAFAPASIGGWNGREWMPAGRDHTGAKIGVGSAPVGLIDDVFNRTQHPLWVHLNTGDERRDARDGHVLVLGAPGSGKTTFLKTLAVSEALLHPPDKLHMYFLSFTGGGLSDVAGLPHAESVVHGREPERVRRLFGRLITLLNTRQNVRGGLDAPQYPIIMLCVDQYEQFRDTYYDQHMADFERLVNEGRSVGIFIVLTATSISAIPDRLRSLIQQRVALRMSNPADYIVAVGQMDTRAQAASAQSERVLPTGRGFVAQSPPLMCQISVPSRMRRAGDDTETAQALAALVDEMRDGYCVLHGVDEAHALPEQLQSPRPLRELPAVIPLDVLPLAPHIAEAPERIITALGRVDDDALSLYTLDWWEHGSHYIVTGPPASGKTNLLMAAVLSAAMQHSPEHVRVLLVDFNGRSLRGLDGLKHVVARVTDVDDLVVHLARLTEDLKQFSALENAPHSAPRIAPRTVIVIDDYDATSEALTAHYDVLRQLRDLVRRHTDDGLHIWAAGYLERTADPLIKQLLLRRSGFGMGSRDSLHKLNVRVSHLPPDMLPEGRAFFAQHSQVTVVQTAFVEYPKVTVNRINQQEWPDSAQAAWWSSGTSTPTKPESSTAAGDDDLSIDIDTAGLIDDLLGD